MLGRKYWYWNFSSTINAFATKPSIHQLPPKKTDTYLYIPIYRWDLKSNCIFQNIGNQKIVDVFAYLSMKIFLLDKSIFNQTPIHSSFPIERTNNHLYLPIYQWDLKSKYLPNYSKSKNRRSVCKSINEDKFKKCTINKNDILNLNIASNKWKLENNPENNITKW